MIIDRSRMYFCLEELAAELPDASWLVAGSGPLLARRIISSIADLDIVADPSGWERVSERFTTSDVVVGLHGDRRCSFSMRGASVEVFDGWHGADASELIGRADIVDGYRFLPLEEVGEFKRSLDRPKDRLHLAALARYLAGEADRTAD